jgi:hypothetical protein
MTKTWGHQEAKAGDRCTNSPHVEIFTTPCCYSDVKEGAEKCPTCGAPIECEYEDVPIAVCTIREEGDTDD